MWGHVAATLLTLSTIVSTLTTDYKLHKLALWIDGHEIEQFVGLPWDIFVIYDAQVVDYLQGLYPGQQLPLLPPEVVSVRLTWQAPDGMYRYTFTHLLSLDPVTLYDPLLSIPTSGYVPKNTTEFQITIPCTGLKTGSPLMKIVLEITDSRGRPIQGSPLKLLLKKRCIAFDTHRMCHDSCKNGGKCGRMGRCDCAKGYYGDQCELAVCIPECINNGTCVSPGVCRCQTGFHGDRCQSALCRLPCLNDGRCVEPDVCECAHGYYGTYCQLREGVCSIPCKNGGTCKQNNKCHCPKFFMGAFCQKPLCKRSCGVHGRCVAPNRCECYRGWRGKYCHKTKVTKRKPGRRKRRKERSKGGTKKRLRSKVLQTRKWRHKAGNEHKLRHQNRQQ